MVVLVWWVVYCLRRGYFCNVSLTEDQVKRGLLLDVVVGEIASILEPFPGEKEALLLRWDPFFVFYLDLMFSYVSEEPTWRVIVFSVRVFMKICDGEQTAQYIARKSEGSFNIIPVLNPLSNFRTKLRVE
ncbi:Uncharacterized protein Rs2_37500 [Raphanus sativus]|nr:Uncharacterized protein Rs2_37500 [Raphanus sativus]